MFTTRDLGSSLSSRERKLDARHPSAKRLKIGFTILEAVSVISILIVWTLIVIAVARKDFAANENVIAEGAVQVQSQTEGGTVVLPAEERPTSEGGVEPN